MGVGINFADDKPFFGKQKIHAAEITPDRLARRNRERARLLSIGISDVHHRPWLLGEVLGI